MLNESTINIIEGLSEETNFHPSFFEKDWYTTQVLNALAKVKDPNFQLVFGGGTSLSKAHRLIQRFSEDIDYLELFRPRKMLHPIIVISLDL